MFYFRKFVNAISEIQRKYIDNYMRRLTGGAITVSVDNIGTPITKVDLVGPETEMGKAKYNELMDTTKIDVDTIFEHTSALSSTIGKHESISKDWVSDYRRGTSILGGKMEAFRRLAGNSDGYTALHYEDFTNIGGASYSNTFIDDSSLVMRATYRNAPTIVRVTSTPYPDENKVAGIYLASPSEFNVEADYDEGTHSMLTNGTVFPGYFLSILLSDDEIRSTVNGMTIDGYTNVLRLFFNGSMFINTLEVDPVGKNRVYVRRVRYRPGGGLVSDNDGWLELTKVDSDQNTIRVVDNDTGKMIMRFPQVSAGALEITLNTEEYDILRMKIDPSLVRSTILWDEITDNEYGYLRGRWSGQETTNKPNVTRGGEIDYESTDYYTRVVNDLSRVSTMSDMHGVVSTALNVTNGESLGNIDPAIADVGGVSLGGYSDIINKNEYVLGAYNISPEVRTYPPSGVFLSHRDGGYDTMENTALQVMLEATQETPAMTSIEYFIVTDAGYEIPIVPKDTTTWRERVHSMIPTGGTLSVNLTFNPVGNVSIYRWVNGVRTLHATVTPTGKVAAFTSLNTASQYVVEYTVDMQAYTPHIVNLPDWILDGVYGVIPSGTAGWIHEDLVSKNHTIPLRTTPYIDYDYYNWDDSTWKYASGVAGYYSDPNVLAQNMSGGMWDYATDTGLAILDDRFIRADRSSFTFNISVPSAAWLDVMYTGTGGEFNEYSYRWRFRGPSPGYQELTLSGEILRTPGDSSLNTNRYEPMEVFVDGYKALDRTNYREAVQDPLTDYDDSSRYEYYLFNDRLYSNINFAEVQPRRTSVRHRYLTSYLKLKVVMYTNVDEPSYHTPSVSNYNLKFLGV